MKLIFYLLLTLFISINILNAESRFGDLTEMRDDRMRGKDNQWVRPHPGPFVWNNIEKEEGVFCCMHFVLSISLLLLILLFVCFIVHPPLSQHASEARNLQTQKNY